VLLEALQGVSGLELRSLYDLYPDFSIDIAAEQAVLSQANIVLWQCPLFWYSVPALLKLWFDEVLTYGWAYGEGGAALRGKPCRWIVTTGGDEDAYTATGMHSRTFEYFLLPVEATARYCQMRWEPPFVLHGARRVPLRVLEERADLLRKQVSALAARTEREHTEVQRA